MIQNGDADSDTREGGTGIQSHRVRMYSPRNQPLGNGTNRNLIEKLVSNMQEAPLHPAFGRLSTKLDMVQGGLTAREVVFRE